nr:extracellular solute-binding protein [Sporohalobacter salinus]
MVLLIIFATGFLTFYFNYEEQENFKIDPKVQLNSEKEYEITYWDYPLFIGQEKEYEEFLEESISEFNDMYPNIKVNYRLLSFIKGRNKLRNRLKSGNPPDIYHGIFGNKLISKEFQIPVNIFFKEGEQSEKERYNKIGLKAFTYNQQIWGLPNWIKPQILVGNQSLFNKGNLTVNQIEKKGWKWHDFQQKATEIADLNKNSSIIFNPYNPKLFYQLLNANGKERLVTSKGDLAFSANDLKSIFEFLDNLRSEEVFPRKPEEMNKKLLQHFWQQKAGIIAPVNMWLLNNLYQRNKQESNINLTLLPLPTNNLNQKYVPIDVTGLLLFRQQNYKGDAHTKAAYKFAKFINQQKNLFIAKKLKVLPAYLPLESLWREEVKLKDYLKQQLLNYSNRGITERLNGFDNIRQEAKIKDVINESYKDFWLEGVSIPEVIDEIMTNSKEIVDINKNNKEDE